MDDTGDETLHKHKVRCSMKEAAHLAMMKARIIKAMKSHKKHDAEDTAPYISQPGVQFPEASAEHRRLHDSEQRTDDWKKFGPYLSERAWGTVREDYSENGDAWSYFPHDHANKRVYRWNEDGIGGFCDRHQRICFSFAFWNEKDPIIKERLFGLTGSEGNHGEDCKELYYYVDGTPTHSYAKMIYKYPIDSYPYSQLVQENGNRGKHQDEFELTDALPQMLPPYNRYFDCEIEWAKITSNDLICKVTATNRSDGDSPLHILPHMFLRNTWRWGQSVHDDEQKLISEQGRVLKAMERSEGARVNMPSPIGEYQFYCEGRHSDGTQVHCIGNLFADNETNNELVFGSTNDSSYPKDTINNHVVSLGWDGVSESQASENANPTKTGSKYACHYRFVVPAGDSVSVYVRFTPDNLDEPFKDVTNVLQQRKAECDEFYNAILAPLSSEEEKRIQRQALAGMLWSKQFFHYDVSRWLEGDPTQPTPPSSRLHGRNTEWRHLYNSDVISMPDKWEYPWYAAWDLAFHTVALTMVDPEWAKRQLVLVLREWYMHPNGAIPAYEWSFSDVNPPVHAWACYRVYKMSAIYQKKPDVNFLQKCFHKLMLNFTWWVNRKDSTGSNLFDGGFLGLDNIGVFDRSNVPEGWHLQQADSTAWMGQFCLQMLTISIELALHDPVYEDMCTKFLEHFVSIALQIRSSLWDEETGFFYDKVFTDTGAESHLKYRSFVGLLTLLPCMNIDESNFDKLPNFKRRTIWFLKHRPGAQNVISYRECETKTGTKSIGRYHFSILGRDSLERVLSRCFDEEQFLSRFGLRSLSKEHSNGYSFPMPDGSNLNISYEPGESQTNMYGGNSNWRGPIWLPTNFAIIEALGRYGYFYQDSFLIEFPTRSGDMMNIAAAAALLSERIISMFKLDPSTGTRPIHGTEKHHQAFSKDEHFRDLVLFHEYFHGETGKGLGATHQTGWTGLIAKLIQRTRR